MDLLFIHDWSPFVYVNIYVQKSICLDEYIYACMCVPIWYNQSLICAIIPMYGYIHTLITLYCITLPTLLYFTFAFTFTFICIYILYTRYITYITLYTLHYITLHNILSHHITSHHITSHHITSHTYIHTYKQTNIQTYMYMYSYIRYMYIDIICIYIYILD